MAKNAINPEEEFDKKLKEVSDAYESGKDAIYSIMSPANRYDIDRVLESLIKLRDVASVSLRANFNIKNN